MLFHLRRSKAFMKTLDLFLKLILIIVLQTGTEATAAARPQSCFCVYSSRCTITQTLYF